MRKLRCLIVEDQGLFSELLAAMLRAHSGIEVVAAVASRQAAIEACDRHRPDVVILDLELPDGWGLAVAEHLAAIHPTGRVVVLSSHAESFQRPPTLRSTIEAVLDKSRAYEDLIQALNHLLGGEEPTPAVGEELEQRLALLTERERTVLSLLGQGWSSQQIAAALEVSVHTADTHRRRISEKLALRGAALIHQATLWRQQFKPQLPSQSQRDSGPSEEEGWSGLGV